MNLHALSPIVAALSCILLAFIVYSKEKPNPINKSFATMLLCVSLWNVEYAGLHMAPNAEFALIWADIFRIPLIFIPPTFLHFSLRFTQRREISGGSKKILTAFYLASCFFALISWHKYFHGEVIATPWRYSFSGSLLYSLFILEFILSVLLSFFHLIQGYASADGYQRQRLKYFFLAMCIGFVIGALNFMPKFGIVEFYPVGNIGIIPSLAVMTYMIVQHRLMDVSLFMAKGSSYILSFTILALPFFFLLLFLENFFYQKIHMPFTILLIVCGVGSVLLFNFIKVRMDQKMLQIIVRDKYKYHEVLDEFSRRLVTIVDLNRLLQMLADTIEKSMEVKNISIFLHDGEREAFRPVLLRGIAEEEAIKVNDPAMTYLQERKEAVLRPELQGPFREGSPAEELIRLMGRLQAEICLPLIYMNRLIGFINLGVKGNNGMYYSEDLSLLTSLANQIAIAIENANLYESLKRSQGIMRRADRLASLGTLIASLAHEIRNPLVSIKTFTQLLPERIDDEEFRNYFLKVASGEIDRLTGLINELLGFARPSEPRPQGEEINALIDKMEVLVATEARKKNVTLSKNYAADLPQIKIDAEQIKQVLLNMLLNAIQSIKGEGKIWIETRMVQVPTAVATEPFVQIEIRDTGMGIPKENLEKIFDPFFSTRPEGSGLGLAISHQIIHEHGGFINVESEVGKGTSFKVHLPLKPGGKFAAQN